MSTFASPLSDGKTNPQGFLRAFGKIFTGSGVIEPDALQVSANTTPDMNVVVSGSTLDDNAILIHTDGHFIQAWNDQDATVAIAENDSGVEKTDAIVAYVDLEDGDTEIPNNPDALKLVAVRRGTDDTGEPTDAEIDTAVENNPWILLAYVTVAIGLGASPGDAINSGNIVDARTYTQLRTTPAGVVSPYAGSTAPYGYLLCDGSAVSRTIYADLFAVIGTTYGNGNGSTTFNLPDFKGRVPVGRDATQTEFDDLGETGGSKTQTLTTANLPSHTHSSGSLSTNTTGSHSHSAGGGTTNFINGGSGGDGNANVATTGASYRYNETTGSSGNHSHTISGSTGSAGSGTGHNNLQPYISINYIVKT